MTRTEPVETMEYAAMMRRMLRAYARRVADADPDDLAVMVAIRDELDELVDDTVRAMRARNGWSWAELASALGTTRQAAHKRYATTTERITR